MTTLVVGLGNRDRGDDAVGLEVADRLAEVAAELDADVMAWERPELDLLEVLHRYDRVIVVDAAGGGTDVGRVHDLTAEALSGSGSGGTHGFGLANVLDLAAALGRMPGSLEVVLIEGNEFSHGLAMSAEVATAARAVAARIAVELHRGDADVPG